MKKTFYLIIRCLLICKAPGFVSAQAEYPLQRRIVSLSPPEQTADKFRFDLQSHLADIVYRHPALYEWQNRNGYIFSDVRHRSDTMPIPLLRRTNISLRHADGKISGDYLPFAGNAFTDSEINAEAIYGTAGDGTMFGSASFSKGRHSGYGWNAIRHAELYLPYVIADSTGGDYRYENYYMAGGYASRLHRGYYGVGGSFRGEIASRQTDPRCANTTSWLTVDASAVWPVATRHWLAVRASYIRNKQHLHLRNWRPNQQDRFFVTYGFGYYDLQESPVSFGIRRMYYMQGIETQATFGNLGLRKGGSVGFTADVNYAFLAMKTEESDAKNLFGSDTHHVNGSWWLTSAEDRALQWSLGLQTHNQFRRGKENIYETYRPDENYPSIYDFRLVDTRKRYTYTFSSNRMQGKIDYGFSGPRLRLELLGGIGADYRSEGYENPHHHWEVWTVCPMLGAGAKQRLNKVEWGINSLGVVRLPLQYGYDVSGGKFRLDYQETFLPYAYYTDRSFTLRNELYVSYRIGKQGRRVGIIVQHLLRNGRRPADVAYTETPGVISHRLSHPASGKVNNHESWISASLFIAM